MTRPRHLARPNTLMVWPVVFTCGVALVVSCGSSTTDADGGGASGGAASDGGSGGQGGVQGSGGAGGFAGASSGGGPFVGPCSRDVTGDVTVEDQADLDALRDVCTIDGDLLVAGTEVTSIELPELATVTGLIDIRYNYALTEVNLPSLEVLGTEDDETTGLVSVQNDVLVSVRLPSLDRAQEVSTYENPALTMLDLSSLSSTRRVGVNGAALTLLDLPALTTGTLSLSYNDDLFEVNAPQWSSGGLYVNGCDSLPALNCPSLVSGQGVEIRRNQSLTQVSLPVLESMTEWLVIVDQPVLEELSFPALTTTQWVEVRQNDALVSIDFPVLETIADNWLDITANPSLEALAVPALAFADPIYEARVWDNPALTTCEGVVLADVPDCQ